MLLVVKIVLFSYISIDKVLSSEISLTIFKTGTYPIIYPYFSPLPNSVFVNDVFRGDCQALCNLGPRISYIKLQFNDYITSCENMFNGLSYINEIDLSGFDFSHVISMKSMFQGCSNLKSIKFGNIDTSRVENMDMTFQNCTGLTSIDLSKFDTNSVITFTNMFSYCQNIISIDASSFKATKAIMMTEMFSYNYKLISIDLSNFDTTNVQYMQGVFYSCKNLKYLNLKLFSD